jgi:hypothetical protein
MHSYHQSGENWRAKLAMMAHKTERKTFQEALQQNSEF